MRAAVTLVAALLNLAAPVSALAQTTTTYQAPTGSVSPALLIIMHLSDGGSVTLNPVVGPNCYLGMTCGFPAGYVGTDMSYTLSDGSTANLSNFNGTFFPLGNGNYGLSGQASGTDSLGRNVIVDSVQVSMHITCRSGRGGGCSKVYTGGTLEITVNAASATETPTQVASTPATPTPTATATQTPGLSAGPLTLSFAKLRAASSAVSPNGSVRVTGLLAVPADGALNPSGGITMEIHAAGFDQTLTWTAAECTTSGAAVLCTSSSPHGTIRFAPKLGVAGWWAFRATLTRLAISGPFAGPLTVTLTQSDEDLASSGTLATCVARGAVLLCR
jgi:hypothetical protein